MSAATRWLPLADAGYKPAMKACADLLVLSVSVENTLNAFESTASASVNGSNPGT
jgi:hypothetical protein